MKLILKKGDQGEDVKRLQSALEITTDGDFGNKTEEAVKKFQKENGLTADGVAGQKTLAKLGLVSTDLTESTVSGTLNIIKHYLPAGEYLTGPTKKEWLFLHHTAGWENPYQTIDIWGKDSQGRIATEFVLGGQNVKNGSTKFDGELVQAFPDGAYAWHLGTGSKKLHSCSVGIEVCNFGNIKNGKTYSGAVALESQIVKLPKPFRGSQLWHRYSDRQIEVMKDFILYIADRDNIDVKKGLVELIHKKGADAFDHFDLALVEKTKGLFTHTNVRKDKVDMFPQPELIDMLLSL